VAYIKTAALMDALNWGGASGGVYMTNGSGTISVTLSPALTSLTLSSTLAVTGTSTLTGNAAIGSAISTFFHLNVAGILTAGNSSADIVTGGTLTCTANGQTQYGTYLSSNINTGGFTGQSFNQLVLNTPSISGGGSVTGGWMLTVGAPASGMSGAINVSGFITTSGAIAFTGATGSVAGSISLSSTGGLTLWGNTGSSYDWGVVNTANTAYAIAMVTGTANIVIPTGTLTVVNSILSTSASGGLGYGTGAGGTVIQGTSKSTGFTLSKVTGWITLATGNVPANSAVSATWTNTAMLATDIVVFTHVSGGTVGSYSFNAQCTNGSATFTIQNSTAGGLNENNIKVQFAILRSATS
jgi:hypothetical protein